MGDTGADFEFAKPHDFVEIARRPVPIAVVVLLFDKAFLAAPKGVVEGGVV